MFTDFYHGSRRVCAPSRAVPPEENIPPTTLPDSTFRTIPHERKRTLKKQKYNLFFTPSARVRRSDFAGHQRMDWFVSSAFVSFSHPAADASGAPEVSTPLKMMLSFHHCSLLPVVAAAVLTAVKGEICVFNEQQNPLTTACIYCFTRVGARTK